MLGVGGHLLLSSLSFSLHNEPLLKPNLDGRWKGEKWENLIGLNPSRHRQQKNLSYSDRTGSLGVIYGDWRLHVESTAVTANSVVVIVVVVIIVILTWAALLLVVATIAEVPCEVEVHLTSATTEELVNLVAIA